MQHSNKLTQAEVERIAKLVDDLNNLHKVSSHILIHGYDVGTAVSDMTNRAQLIEQMTNLTCSVGLLISAGDIDSDVMNNRLASKVNPFFDTVKTNKDICNDIVVHDNMSDSENAGPNVLRLFGTKQIGKQNA